MNDKSKRVVDIDGSILEGGGQILRIAVSLSVLTNVPVHITKIRAGRSKPGLKAQHLKGLEIVQKICQGRLQNAVPDSTEVTFYPDRPRGGTYDADTQTAGSVALLLQIALPCVLFGNRISILKLRGGTNAEMAPQFDYVTEVFRPTLERFGATFDYKLVRRGYFPRGGGEVHIRIQPVQHLKPVTMLDRGDVKKIWGWSFVAGGVPIKVAQTMAESAQRTLIAALGPTDIDIESYKESHDVAPSSGSGINVVCQTSGGYLLAGSALGKRELKPEYVGQMAANNLLDAINAGGCVDSHCQDQIIIFMALASGTSEVQVGPITEHTQTAIQMCELLTKAKFNIVNKGTNSNIIHCTGIGLSNHNSLE